MTTSTPAIESRPVWLYTVSTILHEVTLQPNGLEIRTETLGHGLLAAALDILAGEVLP
jgi:hypothetical protein